MDIQMNQNQRIMAVHAKPVEAVMLSKERWEEVRRMNDQGLSNSEIARQLEIDRKTVRKLLKEPWRPYARAERADTLLASHAQFLRERAAHVDYSARILYQELCRDREFGGSYETVKRFVVPLRAQARTAAELCQRRFETEPGQQSQIDWGQTGIYLRHRPVVLHIFVLTLGYSRRGYYRACANEQLGLFLESHEAAFEYFGGLTRELLYDRPRTVCRPVPGKGWRWNDTFREFARHWGFEPRVCAPYRAQTKGKVESGVKYVKRNFLPGRIFTDMVDVQEQMDEWMATVADVRLHGTTHQRPIDRFATEAEALMPSLGQGSFSERRSVSRIVAEDYLVSYRSNRYSVPFGLIGKEVQIIPVGGVLRVHYGHDIVAEHPLLAGRHEMRILPEHGPGAVARNRRQRFSLAGTDSPNRWWGPAEVEVRDLNVYEEVTR